MLQEKNPIQETTNAPVTSHLVNPFHNTIDLSTSEGKKLHQKATSGLPEADKHTGDSKDAIKFVERIESQGEDFGWKTSGENIGADRLSIFKTPGTLNIDAIKAHCDPKWSAVSQERDLQFCILSNMMFVFIKNSVSQSVLDGVKDDKNKWSRPGGGDGASLLISIYQKNAHGTRASAIVAKTELLAAETKSFNHNIQDVNKFITSKNKEIAFGGESNHDALFQVFKIYESCPVPKFQETISELRRKYNRNDESISTELIMAEALTTYDTLILEKDWITHDPKSVVFANF